MIGTSLASMEAAWATGDKAASTVFRPAQEPVVKGLNEEQEEEPQEEEECTPPKQPCQSTQRQRLQSFEMMWLPA